MSNLDLNQMSLNGSSSDVDVDYEAGEVFKSVLERSDDVKSILVNVVKGGSIKCVLEITPVGSLPLIQLPETIISNKTTGSNVNMTKIFTDYSFNKSFAYNRSSINEINAAIDKLIDEEIKNNGSERLKYCFSFESQFNNASYSFFIDSIGKNIICIQGLEFFINDNVKVSVLEERGDGSTGLNIIRLNALVLGTFHISGSNEKNLSFGSIITEFTGFENCVIPNNVKRTTDEIFNSFVTNNTKLSGSIISLPGTAMYNGRDTTYPQVFSDTDGIKSIRANTPPLLAIKIGGINELTGETKEDSVPNFIVNFFNFPNNAYYSNNVNTCNANSCFYVFLPLY